MRIREISKLLLMCILLQACAVRSGISYVPDTDSITCDDVTWFNPQGSAISGWSVPYYIVPLWYEKWDNSSENLKIKLYFKIETEVEQISSESFYIKDLATNEALSPLNVKLTSNIPYEQSHFLMYEAEFPISSGAWTKFELHFNREVYGCDIPPITYTKIEDGFNGAIL
jgi:hypothetical protein